MPKQDFTYALLRYVPDPERMEPLNIGVVVQGAEGMKLKLDSYFRRKDVDAGVYKRWREFLQDEVEGEQKSIFRPSRESADFWKYLRSLTGDTVTMTQPLKMATTEEVALERVLEKLYDKLVSRKEPEKEQNLGRPGHPAFEFRRIRKERKLDSRGLKKSHALKSARGDYLWAPHRVAENGQLFAVDKIEVDAAPELTYREIDKARSAASQVSNVTSIKVRWIVLIDPFEDDAFNLGASDRADMKRAFEETKAKVRNAKGEILSDPKEVSQFTAELEHCLLPMG